MGYGERFWHFDEATLPPEWASLVGGNASVFMYDGGVKLDSGSGTANDSAAIYQAFDRSLGNYQRITACVRADAAAFRPQMHLLYRPGGPIAGTVSDIDALALVRVYSYSSASNYYGALQHWLTAGTRYNWLDSSKAWSTTNGAATPLITADDDYHVFGIDWDDVLDRVRLFWVHVASGSTFGGNEAAGPKLFALTDWVDLSTIRNGGQTADLYLVIGWLYNSVNLAGATQHIEWVRHEWADALIPCYTNQKAYDAGSGYNLKIHSCLRPDGVKLPISRTGGLAVDIVAATWESNKVGQWGSVCYDPVTATYWMSYSASDGTNAAIGVASATDPFGTWTKYGSNPILPQEAGVHYGGKLQSCLVQDFTEPDPAKRWKLVVSCLSGVDSKLRVYLYTAAQPDTTAWTREGLLIDYDAGGLDGDMGPELYCPPLYLGGQWYLHYVGLNSGNPFLTYVAVGNRLAAGAFTPNRAIDFQPNSDGVEMTITTGSSTSRIVDVNSTAGVAADDLVMYDQDSTSSNWRLGRVRKVLSSTQLELYHRMPGLSTSGVLRTINRGKNYPHFLTPFGDEWLWISTSFAPMFGHATFAAGYEGASLYRSTDPPYAEKPTLDHFNTPGFWLGRDNNTGSTENPRFVGAAVVPYTEALTVRRRRRKVHLRR